MSIEVLVAATKELRDSRGRRSNYYSGLLRNPEIHQPFPTWAKRYKRDEGVEVVSRKAFSCDVHGPGL